MKTRHLFLFLLMLLLANVVALPQSTRTGKVIKTNLSSRKFHLGYSFGINVAGFTMVPDGKASLSLTKNPGINLNLITDYQILKNWNLRFLPGIQFIERDLKITGIPDIPAQTWKIETINLDFPVLVKHSLKRVRNHAPYLIGGFCPRFDLLGTQNENFRSARRMLGRFDFYPEAGVGMDFYLAQVKIAAELKFSLGTLNLFNDPGDSFYQSYTSGVSRLYSRMVVLAFHVE